MKVNTNYNINFYGIPKLPQQTNNRAIDAYLSYIIGHISELLKNSFPAMQEKGNSVLLNKYGVAKVLNKLENGIIFAENNKTYTISIPKKNSFKLVIQNPEKKENKSYYIQNNILTNIDSKKIDSNKKYPIMTSIESSLKTILSDIEYKIIKLKQELHVKEAIPNLSDNIASKGKLCETDLKLIKEIQSLFETAHSSIKNVAKSCNTRSAIKNGYPKLKKGVAGSRILEFSGIGKEGEDISINQRIDHGKAQKAIVIINKPEKELQLVINKRGEIEKNPSLRFIRDANIRAKGDTIQYYSQEEINTLDLTDNLNSLKEELKNYIAYIKSRHDEINKIREQKAENIPGNMSQYSAIMNHISREFNYFKNSINKLSYNALDKDFFRQINKIKTFHAQNSILLQNAMPDGRSLCLVYSKINKKQAMKIFLMNYNNRSIDKSFIIYNNKLAKLFPKKVNDKPNHYDYDFHYFTQEEINNSELDFYMEKILDRLKTVNSNLKRGINERLAKKPKN